MRATIRVGNRDFEAEPAMIVAAPPNFGQATWSMTSFAASRSGRSRRWTGRPSGGTSTIFDRPVRCQWVNNGIHFLFGQNSPSDLTAPALLAKLADPGEDCRSLRTSLFLWFRDSAHAKEEPVKLPPFYGDGFGDLMER